MLGLSNCDSRFLSDTEKNQLYTEVILLEQYLLVCPKKKDVYIVSRKFKRRKTEFDPITKKYLVQYAWGMSNSYLVKLKRSFDDGLFVQNQI